MNIIKLYEDKISVSVDKIYSFPKKGVTLIYENELVSKTIIKLPIHNTIIIDISLIDKLNK